MATSPETKRAGLGRTVKKLVNNVWFVTVFGGFLVAGIWYLVNAAIDVVPIIKRAGSQIESVQRTIDRLNANLVSKIEGGIDVNVGINNRLERNYVITFKGNRLNLAKGEIVVVSNEGSEFKPTIHLFVTEVVEHRDPRTDAELFIGKEAAELLRFKNYQALGIGRFKIRRLDTESHRGESKS